jgi:hypothetical protein
MPRRPGIDGKGGMDEIASIASRGAVGMPTSGRGDLEIDIHVVVVVVFDVDGE